MEPEFFYTQDEKSNIHQGAIYEYRPFFWLDPPLYLLRNVNRPITGSYPGSATVLLESEQSDAFRQGESENQEDVLAIAKRRFVIVLSRDSYLSRQRNKDILVAPIFSFKDRHYEDHPSFVDRIKNGNVPGRVYLPAFIDVGQTQLKEGLIDVRQAKTIKRDFLDDGKLNICVTETALKNIVLSFITLLPTELL